MQAHDAVNVTIEKVRVHKSDSAGDADGGWAEIVLNPARRVNLLDLTNGVLDELGQTPLPAGKYTQLRLVLTANSGSNPLANSVVFTDTKAEVALKTPSGQQSGLKTNIDIDIAPNRLADFVLDFDACKSVVYAGTSGQYLLKPVLTMIPRYISGVSGFVNVDSERHDHGVPAAGRRHHQVHHAQERRHLPAATGCPGQLYAGAHRIGAAPRPSSPACPW
ncbi:DUF4382 domain-containing protein [Polaromonas sp. P1(28)-8]|nr:DUF4382 domain-containing protein [Polaromonas sp. P1(28)-8]